MGFLAPDADTPGSYFRSVDLSLLDDPSDWFRSWPFGMLPMNFDAPPFALAGLDASSPPDAQFNGQWTRDESTMTVADARPGCQSAYLQCYQQARGNPRLTTMCLQSFDTCLKTPVPVVFPGGIWVR